MRAFRTTVWKYWRKNGRHDLPWRKTKDPYRILVSEVMLQQTQVSRVQEKYEKFLKVFPTVRKLARAKLADVLKIWSGLGYNRRGKYLHDAAKVIVEKYNGIVPKDKAHLKALPGIGDYTAGAVRVFAFNEFDVLIETNIRAAFIHHFFSRILLVYDRRIIRYAEKASRGHPSIGGSREWHWALMDYGVYIKKLYKNPARKSAHHVKQSKFEGSLRQVRGAILRALHFGPQAESAMRCHLIATDSRFKSAIEGLERDGLVVKKKGKWKIA